MKKTIGILAHVDAGKTTFSEQLLYHTGKIRAPGRVDYKTSFMDTNEIEQNRGITIFADQGSFNFEGDTYYIIDTPGHVDFSAETERAVRALDYAILLISGSAGVQAHTTTLFRLLNTYKIPVFMFINKSDSENYNLEKTIEEIKNKLTEDILFLRSKDDTYCETSAEFVAERDETFMEVYFNGNYKTEDIKKYLIKLIKIKQCYPVMTGSALKGTGIEDFLRVFSELTHTEYDDSAASTDFVGKVYKIRHDENGNRLTFIKAVEGKLKPRDSFSFDRDGEEYSEKVNDIRIYNGRKFELPDAVQAGDVFAVTGLQTPVCGDILKTIDINRRTEEIFYMVSALKSKVNIQDGTDINTCLEKLRILDAEDPMLSVAFSRESGEILVNVMGKIQLEVLEQLIKSRFGISILFEKPQVQYRETINAPIVGFGHFEPLRHYAEVQLRLEPNPRGCGITFESKCHVNILELNFQRLIKTHIYEKQHRGVLTGSPITDINVVLQDGRSHIKHTSGGDFREATYRAVRQGLEKAESIILEPFYRFEIYAPEAYIGRIMSDITKLRGVFEPPVQSGEIVSVRGRGPVESFMDYGPELVSYTKGLGSISFIFDGYDLCENSSEVIEKIGYHKERDIENLSSSVFCAKGTSFVVKWDEAENYMHTLK